MDYAHLPYEMMPFLTQYRLDARRHTRTAGIGGHVTRRMGQSLVFEDFAHYTPGDDVRYLDWRTTLRQNGIQSVNDPEKWLVRRFVAEEQLKLFVSIDTHDTMRYPVMQHVPRGQTVFNISKLQVALWLAEALSIVALETGDKVVWHPLFASSPRDGQIQRVSRREDTAAAYRPFINPAGDNLRFNDAPIEADLKPAYVWVILTDFYFSHEHLEALINRVQWAVRGYRWVIFVDLDSWQYERALLGNGFRRILGPRVGGDSERRMRVTQSPIQRAEARIHEHKRGIQSRLTRADVTQWAWRDEYESPADVLAFFRARFAEDRTLRRIFARGV